MSSLSFPKEHQWTHSQRTTVWALQTQFCSQVAKHTLVAVIKEDKMSMIGDFGVTAGHIDIQGLLPKLDVTLTVIRQGQDKAKPNPFESLTEADKKMINDVARVRTEELHKRLYGLREKQFRNKGMSYEDFTSKLMSKQPAGLQSLIDAGCIDGLAYAEDHKQSYNVGGRSDYEMMIPKLNNHNLEVKLANQMNLNSLLTHRFRPC
jgi:hypothetical protein